MLLALDRLVCNCCIARDQASNLRRRRNASSLSTVTCHGSYVLSPEIFKTRPLKGTSITPMLEAGKFAALTRKLEISFAFAFSICGSPAAAALASLTLF